MAVSGWKERAGLGGGERRGALIPEVCLILALILFLFPSLALAANRAEIAVDKQRMTVGDVLQCEVKLILENEDGVEDIAMPSFDGFKILSQNTSRQQMTSIVNFKMTSQKTTTTAYMLQPLRLGDIPIGPARFRERGRTVESNTVTVSVVDLKAREGAGSSGEQGVSAPLSDAEGDSPELFFRLIPERSDLYEGERMAVTLYLYVGQAQVSRWAPVSAPSFEGFVSDRLELPKEGEARNMVIGRRSYRVEALDRYLLTASKVGDLTIGPYRAKVLVGDGFFEGRWLNRASLPLAIKVKPLPSEGRPPGFDPARVGRFTFDARLDRRGTEVGQPVTLTVTLEGNVDSSLVSLPPLPEIPGVKSYPPSEKKENIQQGTKILGRRTAEILLVPSRPGSFTVPALNFAYFDTGDGTYKTLSTQAFTVAVNAGGGAASVGTQPGAEKQELVPVEGALRPLHPRAELGRSSGMFYGSPLFCGLVLGPIGLFLLFMAFDGLRWLWPRLAGGERARREREARTRRRKLEQSAAQPDARFATELRAWLFMELELATGISPSGMTYEQLSERLEELGVSEDRRKELVRLLEAIDFARHAPGAASTLKDLFTRAERWRKELGR